MYVVVICNSPTYFLFQSTFYHHTHVSIVFSESPNLALSDKRVGSLLPCLGPDQNQNQNQASCSGIPCVRPREHSVCPVAHSS